MTTWDTPTKVPEMRCDFEGCKASRPFPIQGCAVDFEDGTIEARMAGWRIWTEDGTWHHLCVVHRHANTGKKHGV